MSSFTPITMVWESSLAGAEKITFLAPACNRVQEHLLLKSLEMKAIKSLGGRNEKTKHIQIQKMKSLPSSDPEPCQWSRIHLCFRTRILHRAHQMESQLGRGCGTRQSSDHQQPRSHRQPQQFHRTCRGSCPDCIRWFGGPHANAKTLLYGSQHVFWFTGKTHATRHTAASATSVFDQHNLQLT